MLCVSLAVGIACSAAPAPARGRDTAGDRDHALDNRGGITPTSGDRSNDDDQAAALWVAFGRMSLPADGSRRPSAAVPVGRDDPRPGSGYSDGLSTAGSAAVDVSSQFIRGYRDGDGDEALLDHFLAVVVPCESGWIPTNKNVEDDSEPAIGHRGLTAFSEATWQAMMRADVPYLPYVYDPYWHGMAAARLVHYVEVTPGSTFVGQWSTWYGCAKVVD